MTIQFNLRRPFFLRDNGSGTGKYRPLSLNSPPPSSPTFSRKRLWRRNKLGILAISLAIICIYVLTHRGFTGVGHGTPWNLLPGGRGRARTKYLSERISEWAGECKGWDPEKPEDEDPVDCLKARQYRQTVRVLEREELAKHEHWYFTLKHNRETFRNISRCFLPTWHEEYTECIDKPLIISGWWYTAETITGATTGEVIWQSAVVRQLKTLGMHYAAVGPYTNWVEVAEMMPDVYRFIWTHDVDVVSCITDPRCVAKEHYVPPEDAVDLSIGVPDEERGTIKLWQMQVVDYWGARPVSMSNSDYYWGPNTKEGWSYQPLGPEWIATPWPLPGGHFHLAYSMEDWCLPLPIKPHAERNDTVLLFAKLSSYFTWPRTAPPEFFTSLAQSPKYDLVLTAKLEEGHPLPEGLTTLGPQKKDDYTKLVGESKVMLGMGQPMISPSVYTALCQATPVVLPYARDDPRMDGWNLYGHSNQHGPAAMIGPPYVYTYYISNYTSMVEAVHKAFTTPINRYIPADMKIAYAMAKTKEYINRDLEGMFHQVVQRNGGKIPGMAAGIMERCEELDRCKKLMEPGTIKVPLRSGGYSRTIVQSTAPTGLDA